MANLRQALLLAAFGLLALSQANLSSGQLLSSGQTTAELVRSRGYEAIEHKVTITSGNILTLVEAFNPLIDEQANKDPILCVHGILSRASFFLINPDQGNYAKNNVSVNFGELSLEELIRHFRGDPAANSIVYLALNAAHRVWLLNRRGTSESLGHVDDEKRAFFNSTRQSSNSIPVSRSQRSSLGSLLGELQNSVGDLLTNPIDRINGGIERFLVDVNPKFWNYSLDDQAEIDIPEVIEYILETSKKDKLVYLGHSAGAALGVMALTLKPDLADKLSKVVLWSPAVDAGVPNYANLINLLYANFRRELETYVGPFPPTSLVPLLKDLIATQCNVPVLQQTTCKSALEFLFGPVGDQFNFVHQLPELLDTTSSFELAQLSQSLHKIRMHRYDYGTVGNLRAYNQLESPIYAVSRVRSRQISIWYGKTDFVVTPGNVRLLINDLRVPLQIRFFNESGLFFDHVQFVFHTNVSQLLNIPTLQFIQQR